MAKLGERKTCFRCGGPLEGDPKGYIFLCRTCKEIIDKELEKGRFLG